MDKCISRRIANAIYLESPERLTIWSGWSINLKIKEQTMEVKFV